MNRTSLTQGDGSFVPPGQAPTAAPATLARVSHIELDRIEGVRASWKATTFAGANRTLRDWAESAPSEGGYDKVGVHLVWNNGVEYAYRLDLKHPSSGEEPDIEADLRHAVAFALGRITNPNWSTEQHARVLERYRKQGIVDLARRLDNTCMLGDIDMPEAIAPASTQHAGIELIIEAARRHGEASDPDHEVGDLQDALREAWATMTASQRLALMEHDDLRTRVIDELGGPDPEAAYDRQVEALKLAAGKM